MNVNEVAEGEVNFVPFWAHCGESVLKSTGGKRTANIRLDDQREERTDLFLRWKAFSLVST